MRQDREALTLRNIFKKESMNKRPKIPGSQFRFNFQLSKENQVHFISLN